ncbi:MAG: hypothetical protein AAFX06_24945 [Planctomycetota bacterium]
MQTSQLETASAAELAGCLVVGLKLAEETFSPIAMFPKSDGDQGDPTKRDRSSLRGGDQNVEEEEKQPEANAEDSEHPVPIGTLNNCLSCDLDCMHSLKTATLSQAIRNRAGTKASHGELLSKFPRLAVATCLVGGNRVRIQWIAGFNLHADVGVRCSPVGGD